MIHLLWYTKFSASAFLASENFKSIVLSRMYKAGVEQLVECPTWQGTFNIVFCFHHKEQDWICRVQAVECPHLTW
jgi:hypothetical protein